MEIMITNDEDSSRATGGGKSLRTSKKEEGSCDFIEELSSTCFKLLRTKGTLSDNQIEAFGFKLHPTNSQRNVVSICLFILNAAHC